MPETTARSDELEAILWSIAGELYGYGLTEKQVGRIIKLKRKLCDEVLKEERGRTEKIEAELDSEKERVMELEEYARMMQMAMKEIGNVAISVAVKLIARVALKEKP